MTQEADTPSVEDAELGFALLSRLSQLEAENREWKVLLASAVKIAGEAADEWDTAPTGMRAGKIILALAGRIPGYRADTDAIRQALNKGPDHA